MREQSSLAVNISSCIEFLIVWQQLGADWKNESSSPIERVREQVSEKERTEIIELICFLMNCHVTLIFLLL